MKRSLAFLLAGTALLCGCGGSGGSTETPAKMELRVYQVPAESTGRLKSALEEILGMGKDQRLGSVSSANPGELLVLAPHELQDSIASTLRSIAQTAPDSAAVQQLRLDYWNIDAVPGQGSDDPALALLQPALAKIRSKLGEVYFQLNGHYNGVSSPGQSVTSNDSAPATNNMSSNISYTLSKKTEGILLDIQLSNLIPYTTADGRSSLGRTDFKTAIVFRLGETIVISDSPAITGKEKTDASPAAKAVRLNVVRVDALPSP